MPKIRAPRIKPEKGRQTNLVLAPKLHELLKHYAAFHGRTLSQEAEAALEVHAIRSMLAALDLPGFVEEIRADDSSFDVEAMTAELKTELAEAEAASVKRPASLDRTVELLP